jgi:ferredoxin-NADP reductase
MQGRIGPEAVEAALKRLPGVPRHVYVCGSTGFVEVAAGLLVEAGLPVGAIRTERYGGA